MTKAELIAAVADGAGLTKVEADKVLKSLLENVAICLKKGDKLSLVGFGTFSTVKRAARKGQNPQTGKKISIPASVSPKFKAGKGLRDLVNTAAKKKK